MEILFLGTGAAEGIPSMGCTCTNCQRARQQGGRLRRDRSALLIRLASYHLFIDTPPYVRHLLEQHAITQIDGIFLTHEHYDHAAGLSEFRYWPKRIDLLATPTVYLRVQRREWGEHLPEIAFHLPVRAGIALRLDGFTLVPFEVEHTVPTYGLAIFEQGHKVVIASDTSAHLSNYAFQLIQGAEVLIVNTPFFTADRADHLDVHQALALKEPLGVKHLILTHINHHNKLHDELELFVSQYPGVDVAYDGWQLRI